MALRAQCGMAVAALAVSAAAATLAQGAPAGHLRSMSEAAAEADGVVIRTHGSHTACRFGSFGKAKEGWHRHVGKAVYPCAPEATTAPPSSLPTARGWRPDTPGQGSRTSAPLGPKTGTTPIYGPPATPKPGSSTSQSPLLKTAPTQYHSRKR
jgi:hypothetical protein